MCVFHTSVARPSHDLTKQGAAAQDETFASVRQRVLNKLDFDPEEVEKWNLATLVYSKASMIKREGEWKTMCCLLLCCSLIVVFSSFWHVVRLSLYGAFPLYPLL